MTWDIPLTPQEPPSDYTTLERAAALSRGDLLALKSRSLEQLIVI